MTVEGAILPVTPDPGPAGGTGGSDEDQGERLDRELVELLNEIRILLPGAQILLAFLLAAPFTERFSSLTTDQRGAYAVTFVSATLATILLVAPTAYHRLRFRHRDKERLLRWSNRLCLVAVGCIGIGLGSTAFLVFDIVYGGAAAAVAATIVLLLGAAFWVALPLTGRDGS